MEELRFPDGTLEVYWDQIEGDSWPKIQLSESFGGAHDDYNRLVLIYQKLRDNFLVQGKKAEADDVMFELGWQKQIVLEEPLQIIYGWFFGYGYKPWKYLLCLVVPRNGSPFFNQRF
jgi:hypothetical protein